MIADGACEAIDISDITSSALLPNSEATGFERFHVMHEQPAPLIKAATITTREIGKC
jgi:hypothetical protein